MTPTQALGCDLYRTWTLAELREMFDQHVTGLDDELLASMFMVARKEIWHQLTHLYFDECLTSSNGPAPKHGERWTPQDDQELDRLYSRGIPLADIAEQLGRSKQAICLRLILDWRAVMPSNRIIALGLNPDDY